MTFNSVIFDGKTLSDLFSDVYKNTEAKRAQIDQHPSIMLVPTYQILKTSMKFSWILRPVN